MSSSAICGMSASSCDTAISTRCTAASSAGGVSRKPRSSLATRVRATSARASGSLSGGSATARSASTSTAVPPWPNRITGPKTRSMLAPTISSCAPDLRSTIACTVKPAMRAAGRCARTRSSMSAAAARTCAAPARPSTTPPTSDLCEMSGLRILIATGKPITAAASAAAAGSATTRVVATTGMP